MKKRIAMMLSFVLTFSMAAPYMAEEAPAEVQESEAEEEELAEEAGEAVEETEAAVDEFEYEDVFGIALKMGNVLGDVTMPMVPEIKKLIEIMEENGAIRAMMTGSGPTVFGIFDDEDEMEVCRKKLEELNLCENLYSTSTIV